MDRDRLKDIHQSDLSESRVNEDFVVWMKTKGPFWLLFCLVFIAAFLFWSRYKQGQATHIRDGWVSLETATLPDSLLEVAQQYPDVGAVSDLARLRAAQRYLASVNAMRNFNHTPDDPQVLTSQQRDTYLADSKRLFRSIVDEPAGVYDRTLVVINALAGLAAIAEIQQDPEKSQSLLMEAAKVADTSYPMLAKRLLARAESEVPAELNLPAPTQVTPAITSDETTPLTVDPTLRDLMGAPDSGS